MNTVVQNILVFTALIFAVVFLVRKFVWSPKKKPSNGCGTDDCGCH